MMRSKHRRSTSAPPLRSPTTYAQPKPQRALVSSLHRAPLLLLYQTNIFLPTRFCSCGTCQMTLAKRVFRRCSVVSTDSRKSDWCQVARVLHSSSTMPKLVLSVQRRLPQTCLWENRASQSALPTNDSDRFCDTYAPKQPLTILFWRLEGPAYHLCICNTEELNYCLNESLPASFGPHFRMKSRICISGNKAK